MVLLERLDRTRFNPTVVVPHPGALTRRLDELGVPHRAAAMGRLRRTLNPIRLLRYFVMWHRAVRQIAALIDELDIDLVHCNATIPHLFASPAARRKGVPCIWHVRDLSSPGGWLDAMMTRDAAAIIAISGAVRDSLHHPALAEAKTTVIHNGVDVDEFAPGDGTPVRAELGLDGSTPLAGIVGQIVPWKGHERFLDVAAAVAGSVSDARFLVVGDDRFGDHPGLVDRLKARAAELGLGDKVSFVGWRDDVVNVMNALDVLVVTSDSEPFGRVVVEAMACGKPVVSFRCGGPVEIIEDGETGLLTEPYDTGRMADAVGGLLAERDRAAAMGEAGRRAVGERFSAEACAGKVQAVYERLVGKGGV